jgi:hypothetical protein
VAFIPKDVPALYLNKARLAGLSPWFTTVCHYCGLEFAPVRHTICTAAPRSTPNELRLTAVALFSLERVVTWSLAAAEGEHKDVVSSYRTHRLVS